MVLRIGTALATHGYVSFRYHLARHALRQFAASLKSSAEILVLVGANVVIGLLALSAFPAMYAVTLPPLQGAALLLAHAVAMAIPVALLRKRVLPADVVRWTRRLPIPPAMQLRAEALVAGLLVGPLALLYAVSGAILLFYQPPWLMPARAMLATLFSLALTYACAIAVLWLRSRRRERARFWQRAAASGRRTYTVRASGPRVALLWHRLFWLPFWRLESVVGWQQSVLLAAALASALAWMRAPPGFGRGLLAFATAILMVLLTDRGDKAVREQTALLRPVLAAWPMRARSLFAFARMFSVAPALLVLLLVFVGGAAHGVWQHTAGRVYLALACASQLLLVASPVSNQRFRVSLVVIAIVLLTAVGTELWK
jgi:hypothetical protein